MAKVKVQVLIEQEDYDKLSKISKKLKMKESHTARNLLLMGLEDGQVLDKFGVLDIVMKAGELKNKLKNSFLLGKKEISIDELKS